MHLTKREKQIVRLVLRDEKRAAIADSLGIHVKTVDFHLQHVRKKIRVRSTLAVAVFFARRTIGADSFSL